MQINFLLLFLADYQHMLMLTSYTRLTEESAHGVA